MSPDTIVIDHATKIIKKQHILDDISLTLERGKIYGFQGINGSGKSMLFKAIAGFLHLTSGSICVFGKTIGVDCMFYPHMGCMFGSEMWDEYTGYENLRLLASVKNVIDEDIIRRTLDSVGLHPDDMRPYKKYSLGMKQRLDLAQAIMESPELLLLDEPSNALDIYGLQMLCDTLVREKERGATILVSVHNTPEILELCDCIYTLESGRIRTD